MTFKTDRMFDEHGRHSLKVPHEANLATIEKRWQGHLHDCKACMRKELGIGGRKCGTGAAIARQREHVVNAMKRSAEGHGSPVGVIEAIKKGQV